MADATFQQQAAPALYTAPANQRDESKGGLLHYVRKHFVGIAIASAVIALILYGWSKSRQTGAAGLQSRQLPTRRKGPGKYFLADGAQVASIDNKVPVVTGPATVTAQTTAPNCAAASTLPVPLNVFQDNVGTVGNVGQTGSCPVPFGPSQTGMGGGITGVPIDYAGQCEGVNPAAIWQSTQLLPSNCGEKLAGTSDWSLYAPSNYQATALIAAGQNFGVDTISTTLKNASLDLRPEPANPVTMTAPWLQSSWVDNQNMRYDWSHSLVA